MDAPTVTFTLPANTVPVATPLLLGYLFNWGLFGVLTVQVYIYYLAFPNDRRLSKCLVYGLYTIEALQTALITHDAFKGYAEGFGNIEALLDIQWSWMSVPIFSGIVSCTVELYYAYRIAVLAESRAIGLAIAAVALVEGTAAIVQGAQAFIIHNVVDLSKAFISDVIWHGGSFVCDIAIAFSMSYVLVRKETRVTATRNVVNRIIRNVVETGCLTAIISTVDLALFLGFRQNSYHVAVALTLAKVYSNSLLAIFNSRILISGGRADLAAASTHSWFILSSTRNTNSGSAKVQFGKRSVLGGLNLKIGSTSSDQSHIPHLEVRKHEETWTAMDGITLEDQGTFTSKASESTFHNFEP